MVGKHSPLATSNASRRMWGDKGGDCGDAEGVGAGGVPFCAPSAAPPSPAEDDQDDPWADFASEVGKAAADKHGEAADEIRPLPSRTPPRPRTAPTSPICDRSTAGKVLVPVRGALEAWSEERSPRSDERTPSVTGSSPAQPPPTSEVITNVAAAFIHRGSKPKSKEEGDGEERGRDRGPGTGEGNAVAASRLAEDSRRPCFHTAGSASACGRPFEATYRTSGSKSKLSKSKPNKPVRALPSEIGSRSLFDQLC